MIIFKTISQIRNHIFKLKKQGKTIGFVPTMGCLHDGHLSLVRAAKKETDIVVVSIFVNPIQFGPKEDLKKYPKNLSRDIKFLENEDADILFLPSARQMHKNQLTFVEVDKLGKVLCGRTRPGHFRGVATVVTKLFNIAQPDIAYFGQKDAQQLIIIKKMCRDLNFPIKIKGLPIVRERNNLAMSSRNSYLTPQEKADAAVLYNSLLLAKKLISSVEKNSLTVKAKMRKLINKVPSINLDYIEIVNPNNLEPVSKINGRVLIAVAAWVGKTRLIDNILC
ncbi:MAG: pantoate--beta-alanine ligase [Candidatus Omnitrophota bacterium]